MITEGRGDDPVAQVEIWWAAADKWRRSIQSDEFSQTRIVNGSQVSEHDSDEYVPVELQSLVTAMLDPAPILAAHRPGEELITKANGHAEESGLTCFASDRRMCLMNRAGLGEIVGMPGHSLEFTDYRQFRGMRIARLLIDTVEVGEFETAKISELQSIKHLDESLFSISQPTRSEDQIHSLVVPEETFRALLLSSPEIIWPQPLDGRTSGTASFLVSVDPQGRVREVLPAYTDNERSNDSARRQIMRWRFKPPTTDGLPTQVESVLTFALNTRAWGPASPLSNEEVRKLASNIIEPDIPANAAPPGSLCTLRVAIDSDGYLIETIADSCPAGLFEPCLKAIAQWHFSPVLENGQPRPYRGEIIFRFP
jgi:hypothetical protein